VGAIQPEPEALTGIKPAPDKHSSETYEQTAWESRLEISRCVVQDADVTTRGDGM